MTNYNDTQASTLKMEECFLGMLSSTNESTQLYNSEQKHFHLYLRENLTVNIILTLFAEKLCFAYQCIFGFGLFKDTFNSSDYNFVIVP